MTDLLFSMLCGLLILCACCFGMLTHFGGTYRHKVSDLSRPVLRRCIEWVLSSLPSDSPLVRNYFGAESQQKLLFVPDSDNKPEGEHEISEPALFRFLLNEETLEEFRVAEAEIPDMLDVLKDIDKESKIAEFETHQSSMGKTTDWKEAFHVFIVFKTTSETVGDYWWSLEKNRDYIALQRSRNKDSVKDQCYGDPRNQVKSIKEDLKGKGTIKDLFAILWAHQVIPEKYNILNSNCQSFVTFISQEITEIGYQYQGFFKYSPPSESGRDKKMLDLIMILRGCSDWPPLFTLLQMENIDLVGKMIKSGKYDINAFYNGLNPLQFAIAFSKTKMVEHLLKPEMNADPTTRVTSGRRALQLAATTTMKADIFDLLLAHPKVKVDDVDENGYTALHFAASVANVIAVQKLIENGANPNISDRKGRSPLHLAAQQRDGDAIIDLLLAHPKVEIDDVDGDGETALHWAVSVSNDIAVQKLIDKGASLNIFDKKGLCPLHVAAQQIGNIPIIDLLLEAQKFKGMGDVNDRNERGETALHLAAASSNEITAEHLIKKGADLHCRNNYGDTPLHMAATFAMDMNIIDVLLRNINEGDIQQYRNDERLFLFAKNNVRGLEVEIGDRLSKKGIKPSETDEGSQEINVFLTEGQFDINGRDQNRETPLFIAIRANSVNVVRRLLEKGADPTIRNNEGFTPFLVAVALHITAGVDKDSDILNLLLESGEVDINETTSQGIKTTALHTAIATSNVTAARFLLSKGANPNVADKGGFTPLHWAVMYAKDMDVVELLVNHKDVDVNCLDNEGRSALDYAKYNKKGHGERITNLLREKGAVERENELLRKNEGNTELLKKHMLAFANRKPRKLENFLSDDTISTEDKIAKISEEYLLKAIKDSNAENVRLLLKNGADISIWGECGGNALHWASYFAKTTDLIDAILETRKFGINGVDNDGRTPLHYAIMGINLGTNTRHLMRKGAEPSIADKRGYTPLHFAAKYAKEIETIKLILENEQVDINHCDEDGETALHHAIRAKNVITARCLLEKGADPTICENNDVSSFRMAAALLKDSDVLGLMLETEKVDINESTFPQEWTALHLAVFTSNVTAFGFLLSKGANPNVADKNGATPLHWAAKYAKDLDIVELLLNHEDVDVNCLDIKGQNALDYTKVNMYGHGEKIAKFLREKGLVSQTGNCLNNENVENEVKGILRKACVDSKVEIARFLIHSGVDISTVTWGEKGLNALHAASKYAKSTEILDVIMGTGKFDINGRDVNGETALHHALRAKNLTTARYLLHLGADLTISDNKGTLPLHVAAFHSTTTDIISLILKDYLVDIDGRDVNGMTALQCAIEASNVTTARYLLKKGADPTIHNNDGFTPLHIAAGVDKDSDILNLLLESGKVDINDTTSQGIRTTALHTAIATSNVTAARFLLSTGANPNVADENGATPLHWAAKYAKDLDIVELLLNHKEVDVNYLDNGGRNAIHYAIKNIYGLSERIANRLKEKGAVRVEQERFLGGMLDECTGGEAIGNYLDNKNKDKHENKIESLKKALDKVVVNLDADKTRLPIKNAVELDKEKRDEMQWASRYAEMKGIVDNLLATVLHGTTAPKCTSDAIDENLVKALLENAIVHSNVEKVRILREMGVDLSKTTWRGGLNALHAASIEANTTEILDVILETGEFDINDRNVLNGETALHFALRFNNVKTARHLLEKGADLTIRDYNGMTPFHTAAAFSRESDILELLFLANNNKFDIDHRHQFGMTALHMAITKSNIAAARFLLSKGANPNAGDRNGVTPLHLAAYFANMQIRTDIVKLFLNHKDTNVDYLDNVGRNVLHYAKMNKNGLGEAIANLLREKMAVKAEGINQGPMNIAALVPGHIEEDSDMKTIRFLIENGQDISVMTWGENGANALHLAAANQKTTDLIDFILEKGKFDINGVDNDGKTPLHYAITGSYSTKNVSHLIQLGADPNIADQNGITPLHLVAKNEETTELIDIILETGRCNINPVDSDGRTPLHYAIKRPDPVTINARRLIKMGADPGIADKNGVTPLHMAVRNAESMDLIELLLNTEAVDVNCVDKQGHTPLACARGNKHGLGQTILNRLMEYDEKD